jgi:hypothetical protein
MVFYTVELWRWRAAWEDYSTQERKKGKKLEIAEFPRTPVPDAQNFGRIPFFEGYYQKPEIPDGLSGPTFGQLLNPFCGSAREQKVSPAEAGRNAVAIPAMQQLLDGAKQGDSPTPISNVIEWTPDTAKTLLRLLDKECGEVSRQLRDAADRPLCQFPADGYDDDTRTPNKAPWLRFRKAAQLEAIRLSLHAAAHDGAAALEDLRICLRLTDAIKSEPYMVAAMIHTALAALTMETVWTGLSEEVWDDAQLAQIDQWLGEIDLISSYRHGIETDRAHINMMYQRFASGSLKLIAWRLFPTGWVYCNQIKTNQYFDTVVAQADPSQRTISCDFESGERQIKAASKIRDYIFLAATPGYFSAALRVAAAEALVRQARTACALERYRLKHGAYPEKLDQLISAKLLPALPRDPINNELMDYQLANDGRYALKSIEAAQATKIVAPWRDAWIPAAVGK